MMISKVGGVYINSETGKYYERPTIRGRRTWRLLECAHNLKLARELAAAHKIDEVRSKAGLGRSPYAPKQCTCGDLFSAYVSAGCPDRRGAMRRDGSLKAELRRIGVLEPFWKTMPADKVKPADFHRYAAKRKSQVTEFYEDAATSSSSPSRSTRDGGRAIDLELVTLSNVLRWAVSVGKLESYPLQDKDRPKFRGKTVNNCRQFMPRDADDLHSLAAALFEIRASEALGWQLILEAFTGCRTKEVLAMRWDSSSPGQPGFIDGNHLWVARAKGGVNPFVHIHPALRLALDAMKVWRAARRPKSPWFIPNYRYAGKYPDDQKQ